MVLNFPQQEEEGERWEKDFFDFRSQCMAEVGEQFIEFKHPPGFQLFNNESADMDDR